MRQANSELKMGEVILPGLIILSCVAVIMANISDCSIGEY